MLKYGFVKVKFTANATCLQTLVQQAAQAVKVAGQKARQHLATVVAVAVMTVAVTAEVDQVVVTAGAVQVKVALTVAQARVVVTVADKAAVTVVVAKVAEDN